MSKKTAWWAALMLVGMAAAPAQTDPGLSTKPAGLTLTGEKIAPDVKPPDLSRPEMRQAELASTSAESEYLDASMRGEAWAQTKLGKIYVNSDDPSRIQQGIYLLRQAADQSDAEALFVLGSLAMAGHGMPQSTESAFDYCRRAAELNLPQAQYELAAMYALGRGTTMDSGKAIEWGRKAIDQGNTNAKYSVGRLLLVGEVESDQEEALELLAQAVDGGIDEAGIFLAEAYTSGRYGLPKDERAARRILGKLSMRGNTEAAGMLERMPAAAE